MNQKNNQKFRFTLNPKPKCWLENGFRACCVFLSIMFILHSPVVAQQTDSLKTLPTVSSVNVQDSSSLAAQKQQKSDIDAPIHYDARYFDNDVKNGILYLSDQAVVKYRQMEIRAGKIQVRQEERILIAEALPETLYVKNDSTLSNAEKDSFTVKFSQYPILKDGQQEITGERMVYNFDTQKGIINKSRTEFDGGYFTGTQIKRVDKKVFNVTSGTYSTCDEEDPHFHFWARRMKMIMNERVFAKPIVLYFSKIPVAYLPFAMFPTKSGRKSGILVPRYGESSTEGKFLKGLGYYWAINDYLDAKATADYYDQSGWLFRGGLNYNKRYSYSGRLNGSLTRKNFTTGRIERRWNLNVNHDQTLDKTSRFSVSGQFQSDNSYYKDFYLDPSQRLNRQIISRATYSKKLGRNSLNLSLSETRDLDDNSTVPLRRNLPQISFNYATRPLFVWEKKEQNNRLGRRTQSKKAKQAEQRWWETITFGFNSNFSSNYTKTLKSTSYDTTYFEPGTFVAGEDSFDIATNRSYNEDQRSVTITSGSFNMSYPGKVFGVLKMSQSLNFQENWFDREYAYENVTLERSEQKNFARRMTFNYSATANTELYGLFQPNIGSLKAIRHVVKPRIGFSYAPDFSTERWGYYTDVIDSNGVTQRKDRFSGTPNQKRGSITFGVDNDFQAKVQAGDEEKKIRLFNAGVSGSYNLAAESKKLSVISTRINANPGSNLRFTTSMSHSPYAFDPETNFESDRYLFDSNKSNVLKWMRLTNVNLDASFSLKGKGLQATASRNEPDDMLDPGFDGLAEGNSTPGGQGDLSWSASFALRYNLNYANPENKTKTTYLRISNAKLQLSRNWRVSFSGQLDLQQKQVVQQSWSIYRDLHCWEASFNWYPIGVSKGFYFRINIKSQMLQDIKYERRSGRSYFNSYEYY
ncbi:MAG: hypothetical protein H6696_13655 [Deferribacteres bacterium]|nr:hypothetical protein [Deferribacteres bacterium]